MASGLAEALVIEAGRAKALASSMEQLVRSARG
jgi:hypothetical protein